MHKAPNDSSVNLASRYGIAVAEVTLLESAGFPKDAEGWFIDWDTGERLTPEEVHTLAVQMDPATRRAASEIFRIQDELAGEE
jgi:hypothetical protein